jgi:hypothetical protein
MKPILAFFVILLFSFASHAANRLCGELNSYTVLLDSLPSGDKLLLNRELGYSGTTGAVGEAAAYDAGIVNMRSWTAGNLKYRMYRFAGNLDKASQDRLKTFIDRLSTNPEFSVYSVSIGAQLGDLPVVGQRQSSILSTLSSDLKVWISELKCL